MHPSPGGGGHSICGGRSRDRTGDMAPQTRSALTRPRRLRGCPPRTHTTISGIRWDMTEKSAENPRGGRGVRVPAPGRTACEPMNGRGGVGAAACMRRGYAVGPPPPHSHPGPGVWGVQMYPGLWIRPLWPLPPLPPAPLSRGMPDGGQQCHSPRHPGEAMLQGRAEQRGQPHELSKSLAAGRSPNRGPGASGHCGPSGVRDRPGCLPTATGHPSVTPRTAGSDRGVAAEGDRFTVPQRNGTPPLPPGPTAGCQWGGPRGCISHGALHPGLWGIPFAEDGADGWGAWGYPPTDVRGFAFALNRPPLHPKGHSEGCRQSHETPPPSITRDCSQCIRRLRSWDPRPPLHDVFLRQGYNGFLADIWSSGVILYLMLAGRAPFEHKTVTGLLKKVPPARHHNLPGCGHTAPPATSLFRGPGGWWCSGCSHTRWCLV